LPFKNGGQHLQRKSSKKERTRCATSKEGTEKFLMISRKETEIGVQDRTKGIEKWGTHATELCLDKPLSEKRRGSCQRAAGAQSAHGLCRDSKKEKEPPGKNIKPGGDIESRRSYSSATSRDQSQTLNGPFLTH